MSTFGSMDQVKQSVLNTPSEAEYAKIRQVRSEQVNISSSEAEYKLFTTIVSLV